MRDAGKCFNAISILSLYSFLFLLSFAQTGNYQYNWWFSRHASKLNYHASKLNYHASFTQVKNKKKIAYHSINCQEIENIVEAQ